MLAIYAFPKNGDVGSAMLEVTDLAIEASPEVLHLIAEFFIRCAKRMETGTMRNSHVHIGSIVESWRFYANDIDITIYNTDYEGPAIQSQE